MTINEHGVGRRSDRKTKGRLMLGYLAVAFLAAAALIATKPWLKAMIGGAMFSWVAAGVAIFVLIGAWYVSIRWQRGLDEVESAGQKFAAQWGMTAGTMVFALLLALPPFKDFATAIVIDVEGAGATVNRSVVLTAMMLGFAGVVLMQTMGIIVFSVFWWKSKL